MQLIDRYTDKLWERDSAIKPCPYPDSWGRDRRVSLCAFYEYGEIRYTVAIVHSCLDWRSIAVFNISHDEYTAIANKLYAYKHDVYSSVGDFTGHFPVCGIFHTDYVLYSAGY